jgi:hypothetical protein
LGGFAAPLDTFECNENAHACLLTILIKSLNYR